MRNWYLSLFVFLFACLLPVQLMAEEDPPQGVLFTNVMVFGGTSEQLIKADVLVTGNKIDQVSTEPLAVIASTNMKVIDGGGRTLMPGLINSHTHLNLYGLFYTLAGAQSAQWSQIGAQAAANARDQLMDGFTTIRDVCGMDDGLQKLIDNGTVVGPRIYTAGACISPTSGHGDWARGEPA